MEPFLVETPRGPARVHLRVASRPAGGLVLGHGAGGGVEVPDLVAATEVALAAGVSVALVEQPYRVAGRRAPAPATHVDEAWVAVLSHLREGPLAGLPVVTGGRSFGARVACRTAAATRATGVLCLAFPLHPPGKPERSRLGELDAVEAPVLVVQGTSDPFGMPPDAPARTVVHVPGDHSLKKGLAEARDAIAAWLPALLG